MIKHRLNLGLSIARVAWLAVLLVACSNDGPPTGSPDTKAPPATDADTNVLPPADTAKSLDSLTCDEIGALWHALVVRPDMVACQKDEDCDSAAASGGCGCSSNIGGCGVGVNAAAYAASEGPALASRHLTLSCPYGGACDCGNLSHWCAEGKCWASQSGCSLGGVPLGSP